MAKSNNKPGNTPSKPTTDIKKGEAFGGQLPTSENRPKPPQRPKKG